MNNPHRKVQRGNWLKFFERMFIIKGGDRRVIEEDRRNRMNVLEARNLLRGNGTERKARGNTPSTFLTVKGGKSANNAKGVDAFA